jgi:hypothetical protein
VVDQRHLRPLVASLDQEKIERHLAHLLRKARLLFNTLVGRRKTKSPLKSKHQFQKKQYFYIK